VSGVAPSTDTIMAEIQRSARLLMEPGQVYEVRIPKAGRNGTISGYFNDPAKIAQAVARFDGNVPGIYITLNPCKPALIARAANRLRERAEITTSDADILHRRRLLIDCDPKKPAGISSTDEEHARAISVACGIWDELRLVGWPDPIVGDSGNGAHLVYYIDLPNTPAATEMIKRLLAGIAARCDTTDIGVDISVYNAARITKLFGTMTCKGDSIPDRPHRRSRILEIPSPPKVMSLEGF
jgi:hypothetical protein